MTKKELARALSNKCDITIKFSEEVVNGLFDLMFTTLESGEEISLLGFGNFRLLTKPERIAHNPANMEEVVVPEHKVLKFRPCTALKQAVR